MPAKWSAFSAPKGGKIDGNDDRHNLTDDNGGGSPTLSSRKSIPDAHRGGPYQDGRDRRYAKTSISGTRGSAGDPASRGNLTPVGRQSTPSETRVPGHGGSPQHRGGTDMARQFGTSGQVGVPGVRSNPQPGAGNTAGRMAKRISGRFNNKSKGAKSGGNVGSYGDRTPITANT